jgi:ribonuclease M5
MLRIREAIVVEGRYDKNTLSQVVDALIIPVDGFQVFKKRETLRLLRRVAERRGLIVLTDSDGAGFVIRNHLKSALPPQWVKHAYIPDIYGKERRKAAPGKEGKLGVEGMTPQVLERVLRQAGATVLGESSDQMPRRAITKADLFQDGLSGGAGSRARRGALLKALDLPEHLTPNALVQVLNSLLTYEEYRELVKTL